MANSKLTNFDHLQAAMTKVKEYIDAVDSTKASADHVHGNLTNAGTLSGASMVVVTDANKKITTSSSITTTELGYLDGVTSNVQNQLNGKSASTHVHGNITNAGALATASAVVVTDGNKLITASTTVTTTELGYLDGVTSAIQTQLDGKAPTSHASTATTYGASSATNYGHAMATSTTPKANGTAAVGSETAKFARGDHVHPLQTSVTGNAGSADKVNKSLKVQLNGGTTEGTNQFTFNGSADKTINITPSSIGAAGSSHGTHVTYATATPLVAGTGAVGSSTKVAREDHVHPVQTSVSGNAGSANKVNNNLIIKFNGGTTEGTNLFTFNGSSAKTVNITPSSIGASADTHTHDVVTDLGGIKAVATKDTTTYTDLNV